MSETTVNNFRVEAIQRVRSADDDQIRSWAIEWLTEQLTNQAREVTLRAERAAQQAEWSKRSKLARLHNSGHSAPPVSNRDFGRILPGSRLHKILLRLGSAGTEMRPHPEKWAQLSTEDRQFIVRNCPLHSSIDRQGTEWLEYIKTPESAKAVRAYERLKKWRDDRDAARSALANRALAQKLMSWTIELLESEFALASGERVKWADATIEQHQERIEMLTRNAEVNIDAAARHDAAVTQLLSAEAKTLREFMDMEIED